jgi:hypothetical protein
MQGDARWQAEHDVILRYNGSYETRSLKYYIRAVSQAEEARARKQT